MAVSSADAPSTLTKLARKPSAGAAVSAAAVEVVSAVAGAADAVATVEVAATAATPATAGSRLTLSVLALTLEAKSAPLLPALGGRGHFDFRCSESNLEADLDGCDSPDY